MDEVVIRKYKEEDRSFVRDIAWKTAFIGEPASAFFDDREILDDFLTLYFTDYEPESCFVAEVNGEVVGYVTGAKNSYTLKNIFLTKIIWRLLLKSTINGAMFTKKNIFFILHLLLSFLKGEFKQPNFSKNYPAILHINVKTGFRNLGNGSRLISVYLDYLCQERIPGVHLATMSKEASRFFNKQGFHLLYEGRRSYFNYLLYRDIPIYILGKRLE